MKKAYSSSDYLRDGYLPPHSGLTGHKQKDLSGRRHWIGKLVLWGPMVSCVQWCLV
jgi:hypothetical protein